MAVETNDAHRSILIGIRVVECPNRKEDAWREYLPNTEGFNLEFGLFRLETIILRVPGNIELSPDMGRKNNSASKFSGTTIIIPCPRMKEHDLLSECDRFHICFVFVERCEVSKYPVSSE